MPFAPPKPCRHAGCPNLTHDRYCQDHQGDAAIASKAFDKTRGSAASRGYDRTWQKFREWFLNRHPMCEASKGCNYPATEPHHIVRLEDGGPRLLESNCQALCKSHHSSLRGAGGRV